jgi:arylsulfatase A-like enzyme
VTSQPNAAADAVGVADRTPRPGDRRPANLLFVFGDEHRAQSVGCYGNPEVRTPTLDRLAAEGVRFSRTYTGSPICTPSRGSILTGCFPQRHLALGNDLPIDPGAPSIARALGDAGYASAYVGKWHLGGIPRNRFVPPGPERLGFDSLFAHWNCRHEYFETAYYRDTDEPIVVPDRYEPEVQTELALDWLREHRERAPQQPFCLFLSWGPPHHPYRPLPPGMEDAYDRAAITLRPNVTDSPAARQDLADYYAHITALDSLLDRLLAYLRETDQLEDTVVVYSSDHGTMLESHDLANKQWPYEESIAIPFLLRYGRRVPAGTVVDELFTVVDFVPTLLGLMGVRVPEGVQGLDFSPHILVVHPSSPAQFCR